MRSLVGLLLNLVTGHQTVSLVDEPEAFLHPPQARYLARLLSDESLQREGITVLATHSSDVVHGTLEGAAQTTVVRLTRDGAVNRAAVLSNDAVRKLWDDPLLKYSNLLEGLFSDGVVVCEGDSDCKYFSSIKDTIEPDGDIARPLDLLFTNCGGKHRLATAVEALRAANVPVFVIADFDLLREWEILSRIVQATGSDPDELRPDWTVLNAAMSSGLRNASKIGMKEAVLEAFDSIPGPDVDRKSLERIKSILRIESAWDRAKKSGIASVPPSDPHNACKRLLACLRTMGIHVVPVGELESFVPAVGGHGTAWVAEVLEKGLHLTPDSDDAREFISQLVAQVPSR